MSVIEFFQDAYTFLLTGAGVTLLVGALLYWYAVHIDSKQYDDFDKKYRESREENKKLKN